MVTTRDNELVIKILFGMIKELTNFENMPDLEELLSKEEIEFLELYFDEPQEDWI